MHTEMWEHPAVQHNIESLEQRGVLVLEPEEGRLAGGDFGKGRLPVPDRVVAAVVSMLAGRSLRRDGPLAGLKVVVSAGGTREPLDPVRYIGNRSSGKQGYAIAAELLRRGASGDARHLERADLAQGCRGRAGRDRRSNGRGRARRCLGRAGRCHGRGGGRLPAGRRFRSKAVEVLCPDHSRARPNSRRPRRTEARRKPGQVLVGFAAETAAGDELVARGRAKLVAKGADIVVANDVGRPEAGAGHDQSSAVIVSRRVGNAALAWYARKLWQPSSSTPSPQF